MKRFAFLHVSCAALFGALLPALLPASLPSSALAANIYSVGQEIALGRQMAAEIEKQNATIQDPIVAEYVNRLGQNLAREASVPFPITVRMIQSPEINAFTLPGGYVYVNSGMLMLSDNEAEFASVLAHEIGHAAARHATRQQTRGQLARLAPLASIFLGGWGGLAAQQAGKVAGPLTMYHFSRAFEKEADLLGAGYLYDAGYDAQASIDMFERIQSMEKRQPGAVSKLFQSHPPTADRIAAVRKFIAQLSKSERGDSVLNTAEYEDIRRKLKELSPPAAAE